MIRLYLIQFRNNITVFQFIYYYCLENKLISHYFWLIKKKSEQKPISGESPNIGRPQFLHVSDDQLHGPSLHENLGSIRSTHTELLNSHLTHITNKNSLIPPTGAHIVDIRHQKGPSQQCSSRTTLPCYYCQYIARQKVLLNKIILVFVYVRF